jgi:hypothetical protein
MPLRTVEAVRYVMPFREGSSVPALVEGDDLGLYLVKLRGAGQGPRALIAELVAGELARAAGLRVPELVLVELDRQLARAEPDPELCLPLEKSAGLNLGLDYLPGSITFDPIVGPAPDAVTASRVVLFDALVTNVDRTPRNPNLLSWHKRLWLIDHGAALYFHHGWSSDDPLDNSRDVFKEVKQHVLLRWASALDEAAEHLRASLAAGVIDAVTKEIPAEWLGDEPGFASDEAHRAAYATWLRARVEAMPLYLEEAHRARALLV